MPVRFAPPCWGLRATLALALLCALVLPVAAQPKKGKAPPAPQPAAAEATDTAKVAKKSPKEKTFDFNALGLNGRQRTPQLLYFLERVNEELERASLEKRSFIPHMVRSVDEEAL
jgi:hypothetical protein